MDDDVKDEVKYRLRDPFYSSWLISFVIWNWKAIAILLYPSNELGLFDRFREMDNQYPENGWIHTLLLPFITGIAAFAFVPWFVNQLDKIRYRAYVNRKNDHHTRDEKLKPALKQIEDLKAEVARLNKANEQSTNSLDLARDTIKQAGQQQRLVLRNILQYDVKSKVMVNALHGAGEKRMDPDPALEFLTGLGVVNKHKDNVWSLTELGSQIAKEF